MTTPSKAALRAAHEITKAYGSVGGNYTRDAELIDREFAELLAVCREISKWAHMMDDGAFDNGLPMDFQVSLDAALDHVDPQPQGERP